MYVNDSVLMTLRVYDVRDNPIKRVPQMSIMKNGLIIIVDIVFWCTQQAEINSECFGLNGLQFKPSSRSSNAGMAMAMLGNNNLSYNIYNIEIKRYIL